MTQHSVYSHVAGDGTTTATVLTQAIFREGVKTVAAGANPMAVKRGIEAAVAAVTEEIRTLAKAVKGEMIAQVATVSAMIRSGRLRCECEGDAGHVTFPRTSHHLGTCNHNLPASV